MNAANDTYAVLEFQGYVAGVPTYDRETGTLSFVAEPLSSRVPLPFYAKGELAKAFKTLLHKGCLVQVQATPTQRIEEWGEEQAIVIRWEAKEMKLLGKTKVNLGKFADPKILDGLMPSESEVEDVGMVSQWWDKFHKGGKDG